MNKKQQKRWRGFLNLKNGDDNAFTKIKNEGGEKCPNNNCMDVVLEEVINYLEFVETLTSKLEEHDVLSLHTKKYIMMMNMKAQGLMEDHVNNLKTHKEKFWELVLMLDSLSNESYH